MNISVKSSSCFKRSACKKIAELTEVVHLLFVQNEEKNEIINEMKRLFSEYEMKLLDDINLLQKHNQTMITVEEKKSLISEIQKSFMLEEEEIREHYSNLLDDVQRKLEQSLCEQSKLKNNIEFLKSQISRLTMENSEKSTSYKSELRNQEQQILKLNDDLRSFENWKIQNEKKLTWMKSEYKGKIDKLSMENVKQSSELIGLQQENSILKDKCKMLEAELFALDQQKKQAEKNLKLVNDNLEEFSEKQTKIGTSNNVCNLELEKELNRYKLELCNRENNFNKLFGKAGSKLRIDQNVKRASISTQNRQSEASRLGFHVSISSSLKCNDKNSIKIVSAQYREKESHLPVMN